jgi:dTDP-4-amino-4,6-dideoxygalactose transaminase
MINVTKPFLPPYAEYEYYLKGIWERNWLTNNGPLVNELELRLKDYLGLQHMLFTGNGTIALQIAIKALGLQGEIITTPFSYVATTSSIVWEGCKPVFVDIDPLSLNIDPSKIEAAITSQTSAILATHVYGNPCEIDAIAIIAEKHKLKVIYDGAHCFGSTYRNKSVFSYGDISTASFHATKLFHTTEGGAVFTKDAELLKQMSFLRNFGHSGIEDFTGAGINGKNSEFHAAMGLCNLKYADEVLQDRKKNCHLYDEKLDTLQVQKPLINPESKWNHSYYPVIFKSEEQLLKSFQALNDNWIYARRYFYPTLSKLHYVKPQATPVADSIAKRVLCLPLYHGIREEDISLIARLLLRIQNN